MFDVCFRSSDGRLRQCESLFVGLQSLQHRLPLVFDRQKRSNSLRVDLSLRFRKLLTLFFHFLQLWLKVQKQTAEQRQQMQSAGSNCRLTREWLGD